MIHSLNFLILLLHKIAWSCKKINRVIKPKRARKKTGEEWQCFPAGVNTNIYSDGQESQQLRTEVSRRHVWSSINASTQLEWYVISISISVSVSLSI